MNNKVTVVADDLGSLIHVSSNPEYGYVRIKQTNPKIIGNWLRNETRTALIAGKIEDLKNAGFVDGQELPGKIVVRETLVPINEKDAQKGIKVAGDTGIPCMINTQPIYRETYYSANENEEDILLNHDNSDDIKAAVKEQKKEKAVQL